MNLTQGEGEIVGVERKEKREEKKTERGGQKIVISLFAAVNKLFVALKKRLSEK